MPLPCLAIDASQLLSGAAQSLGMSYRCGALPLPFGTLPSHRHAIQGCCEAKRRYAVAAPCFSVPLLRCAHPRIAIAALCQAVADHCVAMPWRFGAGHCRGRAMLNSAAARPLPCRCVAEISCATPSRCVACPSLAMPQRFVGALRFCGDLLALPCRALSCIAVALDYAHVPIASLCPGNRTRDLMTFLGAS